MPFNTRLTLPALQSVDKNESTTLGCHQFNEMNDTHLCSHALRSIPPPPICNSEKALFGEGPHLYCCSLPFIRVQGSAFLPVVVRARSLHCVSRPHYFRGKKNMAAVTWKNRLFVVSKPWNLFFLKTDIRLARNGMTGQEFK